MMPGTQATLVRLTTVNYPTGKAAAELGRYLRLEYDAAPGFAQTLTRRAVKGRAVQRPKSTGGAVRRFLAALSEAVGAVVGSPGGA